MFREKLKKDLDGISPDEELLSRVSQMMAEEAAKPKQPIYMNAVKWGSMAAAICLIAVGAVTFMGKGRDAVSTETADTAIETEASDEAAYAIDMASLEIEDNTGIPEAYSLENKEATSLFTEFYCSGSIISLSEDEKTEILRLVESYVSENEYAMLDLTMSDTEIEEYKNNGLYICMSSADGQKIMVLADENSSYIFYKWDFYSLDSDTKAEFLGFSE